MSEQLTEIQSSKTDILNEYAEACFDDIEFFAKEFLSHLIYVDGCDFHRDLYRTLEYVDRAAIAAPRGFAKSTIVSVIYPIWLCVCGFRRKDVMLISASEGLAVELLRKIKRELEGNIKLRQYFGDFVSDKWSETHIVTKTGVTIMARGAGGQIRGFRPDCVILDDIETDELVESEEQRKKLKDWLFKACLNTLLPHGQLILIGTILSESSLLSDILREEKSWELRKYQAYIDGKEEPGHELWPKLWTHDRLQTRKKEIGSVRFSQEYMNDPLSDEASAIKASEIRYWTELPTDLNLVIALDPAYKDDNTSDFKVAVVVGTDAQMNRYLVSYLRTHDPLGDFIDSCFNLWMRFKFQVTAFGVPAQGVESAFARSVIEKAQARNLAIPIVELENSFRDSSGVSRRRKDLRIRCALQPLFEQGKYFINESMTEAKDELLAIGHSRWDDIVDAMTYAETLIQPVYSEKKEEPFRAEKRKTFPNYGLD